MATNDHSSAAADNDDSYGVAPPSRQQYVDVPNIQVSERSGETTATVQLRVTELPHRIERNTQGYTVLHLTAVRDSTAVRNLLENQSRVEAIAMLNERTENEGWTCLHISTIVNNANVISYILDKIQNEEERRQFIGEMDILGWTSLHWGCMLDNTASVEETMNKLSLDDQVDLMTRSWSLLHATVQGNAINTMKCLMDRFEDDTTRWKIIKCATLEGKTALHIAIADGKAKAVIMLLDIAGKDSKKLLAIRDRSNRTAQSYTSGQFPLLEQYVESAVKFESPPLHQAALDNDRLLAEWILVTHPDSYGTQISKRNQDGLTVLHSASHANSIEVIEEISKMMTEEEFVNHLLTRSDGGRTALHLAVVHNNPAAIHTILKRIQNSVERKRVMDTVDEGGETALQVSKRLGYNTAEQILEYHQQLVSTEKEKLFHQVQHTFYTLNIPDEKIVSWSQITKEHAEDDLSTRRDVNYDATVSLLQDNPDIEESRRMVEVAQRVDPDNINTWCNKGSLLVLEQSSSGDLEEVAFKLMDLLVDPSGIPRLRSKIEFAYRLAESHRTEEAKLESYRIFQKCQEERSMHTKPDIWEFCAYLYLKILVRDIRCDDSHTKDKEWFRGRVLDAVEQLLILNQSDNNDCKGHMWLWLAELQLVKIPPDLLQEALEIFSREANLKISKLDIESCLNRAMKLKSKTEDKKFSPRLAKNCLSYSYKLPDETKMHWLQLALEISEQWIKRHGKQIMCASTSAKALIHLWSMEYYSVNRQHVESKFYDFWNRKGKSVSEKYYYLQNQYYGPAIPSDECTLERLQQAKLYLEYLASLNSTYGVKYARVMSLLADPPEVIEQAFREAEEHSDPGYRRASVFEHWGYFCGTQHKCDEAKDHFDAAYQECDDDTKPKLHMARNGLQILADMKHNQGSSGNRRRAGNHGYTNQGRYQRGGFTRQAMNYGNSNERYSRNGSYFTPANRGNHQSYRGNHQSYRGNHQSYRGNHQSYYGNHQNYHGRDFRQNQNFTQYRYEPSPWQ